MTAKMIRKGSQQLAKDLEELSKAIETLPLLSSDNKNFSSH